MTDAPEIPKCFHCSRYGDGNGTVFDFEAIEYGAYEVVGTSPCPVCRPEANAEHIAACIRQKEQDEEFTRFWLTAVVVVVVVCVIAWKVFS